MTAHAKLSASGSSRWLNCPGSVEAEEGLEDKSSSFAEEGSCAHEVGEQALVKDKLAIAFIGQVYHNNRVTLEMANFVQLYVDYVEALHAEGTLRFIETRVDYSKYVEDGFGTADAIILTEDTLHVIDLKYGRGVEVSAENNTQGMIYALGALDELSWLCEIKKIVIHIVQPRKGNYSEWTITPADLLHWANEVVVPAAVLALSKNAPRKAGESACLWCKAKGTCTTLYDLTSEVVDEFFENEDYQLTAIQVKRILDNKSLIEGFMKAVEGEAQATLEMGDEVLGYKLVAGRSVRAWNDDAEANLVNLLGEGAYNKKIIGLGDAEKLVSKVFVSDNTTKNPPKNVIAPQNDRRKEVEIDGFEAL